VSATRFEIPGPDALSPAQRLIYDRVAAGPRGFVPPPVHLWLACPDMAEHAEALGAHLRFDSVLPDRLRELAILTLAGLWRARFEFEAHTPIGLAAGLPPAVVEALREGAEPVLTEPREQVTWRLATTLLTTHIVPDALWDEVRGLLAFDEIVCLVGVLGYYTLISLTVQAFAIGPDRLAP
jgi:4-carboxymuconolactone decarboxylase